jgi:DNA-binding transcriptional LysR family regulator
MSFDWDDLKVLLAISRTGSVTGAAALLGLDQSTVGRRVSALEAELGAILFVRAKTGFVPTEFGETAIARAIEVEARILRLTDEIAQAGEGPVGLIRLVGNPWTLAQLVNNSVSALLSRHPRLELRMIGGLAARTLGRGEPTLALWFESPPNTGEFAIKLGDIPYAIYASRYAADPRDLDWVSFHTPGASPRSPSRWLQSKLEPGEVVRFTASEAPLLQAAIRAGIGKGPLPMCLAELDPGLIRVSDGPHDYLRTLHLHAHPDTIQTARIQATMTWLRESFAAAFLPPTGGSCSVADSVARPRRTDQNATDRV